jgi:hypothetical protein
MMADTLPSLGNLYFGKDDAESDMAAGGLLERGFLPTSTFETVAHAKKSLIIGRKGSGKSAICVILDKRRSANNTYYSLVTPDEISSEELRRFELPGINESQAKTLLWSYVLNVQVAKCILEAYAQRADELPDSLRQVRRFLLDNNEVTDLRFSEKLWRIVEKLRGSLSLEAFGVKLSAEAGAPSEGIRVSEELGKVEEGLRQAYLDTDWKGRDPTLVIMVDQLERVWVNDSNSDHMIVGLLQASKHVSAWFEFVNAITFLRTDIYDFLQFQDRDKYRGEERGMDWSRQDLTQLLHARAKASLKANLSMEDIQTRFFPSAVRGKPFTDYLLDRTLLRPRDIIQFANLCRDTAEKNGHGSIEEADVLEATIQYSGWKLRDLIAEYLVNYPFLNDLFVLFQNSSYVVTRHGLEAKIQMVQNALAQRFPDQQTAFGLDNVLDVLYVIGFLGVLRPSGPSYSFAGSPPPGPADETFLIHPAFRDALRSTSSIDLRPPDFDRLRNRIQDRTRAVLAEAPVFRGERNRLTSSIALRCEQIIDSFTRSDLPEDVKTEVRLNLTDAISVCQRLATSEDSDFERLISELISEVIDHLTSLRMAIRRSELTDARELARLARHLEDTAGDLRVIMRDEYRLGPGSVGRS